MAIAGTRYTTPDQFEFDVNGVPLAGGQLYFYASNTATPLDTYQDIFLQTANPNPVVADANGRFGSIFLNPLQGYRVQLWTATPPGEEPGTPAAPSGSQIWSFDSVGPGASGTQSNTVGIVGEIRQFAGLAASIPNGWYACYGQAVSRTSYASLFTVIGTLWGAGDGSSTFNLPDLRGRTLAGKDDMGGVPANRLTAGASGVPGTTIGGVGGNQVPSPHSLSASSTVSIIINDPGHVHVIPGAFFQSTPGTPLAIVSSAVGPTNATRSATTGITATGSVTTSVSDNEIGDSANVQPTAIVISIIFAGA